MKAEPPAPNDKERKEMLEWLKENLLMTGWDEDGPHPIPRNEEMFKKLKAFLGAP